MTDKTEAGQIPAEWSNKLIAKMPKLELDPFKRLEQAQKVEDLKATITQLQAEAVERAAEVERLRKRLQQVVFLVDAGAKRLYQGEVNREVYFTAGHLAKMKKALNQPPSPGFGERVLALAKDYLMVDKYLKNQPLDRPWTDTEMNELENLVERRGRSAQAFTPEDLKMMGVGK